MSVHVLIICCVVVIVAGLFTIAVESRHGRRR